MLKVGDSSAAALKLLRNEQRAKAFKECQDNAWRAVRHMRVETISILDLQDRLSPLIIPGCTVRIWSCEALPANYLEKLIRSRECDSTTSSYHLSVEIIPARQTAAKHVSFSIGYMFEKREKMNALAHMVEEIPGVLITPDPQLNDRLDKQFKKQHAQFLYLVAVGELTREHVGKLQRIIDRGRVARHHTGRADVIISPMYDTYRQLSGRRSGTHNCTTFVLDVFEDLLSCRASYLVANPAWCRALNLTEENFPGCNDRGLLLHEGEVLRQVMKQSMMAGKIKQGASRKVSKINMKSKLKKIGSPIERRPGQRLGAPLP